MLIDAAQNEIKTDRCGCGRHKFASRSFCCRECYGSGFTGIHTAECSMVQEHFPDTRRGVRVAPDASLLPVGDMTRTGFVQGTTRPQTDRGQFVARVERVR